MTAGAEPTDGLFQAQGKVEGYGGNNLEDFSISMKRSVGFTFHNRDRIEWKYKVAQGGSGRNFLLTTNPHHFNPICPDPPPPSPRPPSPPRAPRAQCASQLRA